MSPAITFDELEGRSSVVSGFAIRARLAFLKHHTCFRAFRYLVRVSLGMESLLRVMHSPEVVRDVTKAPTENLLSLAAKMADCLKRTEDLVSSFESVNLGIFSFLPGIAIKRLKSQNLELAAHIHAFRNSPLLLTKKDQDALLADLFEDSEPNEALQAAAREYTSKSSVLQK